ncbi:hypothetical protein [Gemmata sp.]|uniref:hypothetical protein n=1 Tax=Gemmata sp. TaxID=1914242 RepID=UPI003F6E66B4
MDAHEYRRQIAIARLDVAIDVMIAWRGRYEDDERPVTKAWVIQLCPTLRPGKLCGVLMVNNTVDVQGIGYMVCGHTYKLVLRSRCGTLQKLQAAGATVTRGQFREAAQKSGVSLPAEHATLYLRVDKDQLTPNAKDHSPC